MSETSKGIFHFKNNSKWGNKAKKYINDKDKTNELLKNATLKAEGKKDVENIIDKVKVLFSMISDYTTGKYKSVSTSTIITSIAAVIYFVTPVDAVLDAIPVLGLIDDAAVLGYVIKIFDKEIKSYKLWKDVIEFR